MTPCKGWTKAGSQFGTSPEGICVPASPRFWTESLNCPMMNGSVAAPKELSSILS